MYATHLGLSLALYEVIKEIQVKTTRYIWMCWMFYVRRLNNVSPRLDPFDQGTLIFNTSINWEELKN
jgi:hypothetical protein